jgi:hypothetical protein
LIVNNLTLICQLLFYLLFIIQMDSFQANSANKQKQKEFIKILIAKLQKNIGIFMFLIKYSSESYVRTNCILVHEKDSNNTV